ncbi:glycosyltransferase [Palleronia sediminis]|nr:glycosyltransferase [Palleronia sediminis]
MQTGTATIGPRLGDRAVPQTPICPDPRQIDALGASLCARETLLPLGLAGAVTPVAMSDRRRFRRLRPTLESVLGPVVAVPVGAGAIHAALDRHRARALTAAAETRCPAGMSLRSLRPRRWRHAALLGVLVAALAMPMLALWLALAVTAINAALTLAALVVAALAPRAPASRTGPERPTLLPRISVIVPLLGEAPVLAALIARLDRLDYPRDRLDIVLAVERDDAATARALATVALPPWMRVVAALPGRVRTKPRALNLALDRCRGTIVGIYDAEDAPEPDQLLRVADAFARASPRTACLQGRLNFYNARANWITRCFAIEYAVWFTLILPALSRLGWPVPLGGTSVFFRRDALEAVGGWDAHNVTEDADLGMRLARAGYRTGLLDSTTWEEATASPGTWMRQRSRWQKGYAATWACHMRAPARLRAEIGIRGFVGMQILFLGSLGGCLVAPVLWSFWAVPLGLPHPLADTLSRPAMLTVAWGLAGVAVLNGGASALALCRLGRPGLIPWIPLRQLYYPLASLSLLKASAELFRAPFYWDKTAHGVTRPDTAAAPDTAPAPDPVPSPGQTAGSRSESLRSRAS